jgi:hypothetical protein
VQQNVSRMQHEQAFENQSDEEGKDDDDDDDDDDDARTRL